MVDGAANDNPIQRTAAVAGFVFGTVTARSIAIHSRYSNRTFAGHRSPWRMAVHRVTAWGEQAAANFQEEEDAHGGKSGGKRGIAADIEGLRDFGGRESI